MDPLDDLLGRLNTALNLVSAACGLLVVVIIVGCMAVSYASMDRVSIRFTLAVSVVDVAKALVIVFYNDHSQDDAFCTAVSFAVHYLTLVYLFLNAAVALNLQLVFFHGLLLDVEWLLWVGSLGLPGVLLLVPLLAGKLGLQGPGGLCEFRNPETVETLIYTHATFTLWGFLACFYCTFAVALVTIRLRTRTSVLDKIILIRQSTRDEIVRDNLALKAKINRLIGRM